MYSALGGGQYAIAGRITGRTLFGHNDLVERALPLSVFGTTLAVLRPDASVALFHLVTLDLLCVVTLPEDAQMRLDQE